MRDRHHLEAILLQGGFHFYDRERGGASALVMVTLTETCPAVTEGAGLEVIPIEGGCVEYQVPPGVAPSDVPSFQPNGGLSFTARSDLVAFVRDQVDLTLCGADAPPC